MDKTFTNKVQDILNLQNIVAQQGQLIESQAMQLMEQELRLADLAMRVAQLESNKVI